MIILKTFKYRNIEIQETADAWICSQNKKLLEEPVGRAASVRRRGNADISGWNPASREWRREITKNARGEGKVWDGQKRAAEKLPIIVHRTSFHPVSPLCLSSLYRHFPIHSQSWCKVSIRNANNCSSPSHRYCATLRVPPAVCFCCN